MWERIEQRRSVFYFFPALSLPSVPQDRPMLEAVTWRNVASSMQLPNFRGKSGFGGRMGAGIQGWGQPARERRDF